MRRSLERGFTLVEIMIVVAIIALLAAIAIPNVLRARATANESAAVGNIRALMSSLEMVRSVNGAYPTGNGTAATAGSWLNTMYGTACGGTTAPDPDFGPASFCIQMNGTLVQGFNFTYTGVVGGATYTIRAIPQALGNTGTRCFFVNETGLVRHCADAIANCTDALMVGENTIDVAPNLCNNSTAT